MIILYFVLFFFGIIFFGLAGGGAVVTGLASFRLRRYQYKFMGLRDNRFVLFRFWRYFKFSLYQPTICIFLALLVVTVLSLIIKPSRLQEPLERMEKPKRRFGLVRWRTNSLG